MVGQAVRVVAIAVLVAALWALVVWAAIDAARLIDRRFRETRYVVKLDGCPLAVYRTRWREEIAPDCTVAYTTQDGS